LNDLERRAEMVWDVDQGTRLMFGQAPIGVVFVCPKCTSLYVAMQERRREKITGRFDCTDCGAMVHAWSGVYDYPSWRLTSQSTFRKTPLNGLLRPAPAIEGQIDINLHRPHRGTQ
jgi:predicted RNA-binding Zn-ribbon protein involved in translation (DUF1610 family)